MKKIYSLFLVLLATAIISAQALLTIVKTSEGVYTMTYNDATNAWAFYNPNSAPIGVYLFINPADSSANANYDDLWGAITTTLTWNGTNYSGTINLNTHNFNQTGGVLPVGTTINQLNFLFTESPAGNSAHQTTNKLGTNYGFTPSTLAALGVSNSTSLKNKTFVTSGKLYTSQKGNLDISIYEFSGKVVKTIKVNGNGNPIDLNLAQKGLYLLKVGNEVVKFAY